MSNFRLKYHFWGVIRPGHPPFFYFLTINFIKKCCFLLLVNPLWAVAILATVRIPCEIYAD